MKKLVLLAWLLLACVSLSFGQSLLEYEGEGYGIKYPKGWVIEEVSDEGLVKFSSPDEEGIFQVIITDASGRSAIDCLNDWMDRTGYTNENSEAETQMPVDTYQSYNAEDGATGTFEPNIDGVDIFMNVDIYIRDGNAIFLIATTTVNDDHGYIKMLGTMAGSFELN